MGREAGELLIRRRGDGQVSEVVLLPPELTIRTSTAPPPVPG
jgi:DNA-binding LacI/PurR family transcriptional regulator